MLRERSCVGSRDHGLCAIRLLIFFHQHRIFLGDENDLFFIRMFTKSNYLGCEPSFLKRNLKHFFGLNSQHCLKASQNGMQLFCLMKGKGPFGRMGRQILAQKFSHWFYRNPPHLDLLKQIPLFSWSIQILLQIIELPFLKKTKQTACWEPWQNTIHQ